MIAQKGDTLVPKLLEAMGIPEGKRAYDRIVIDIPCNGMVKVYLGGFLSDEANGVLLDLVKGSDLDVRWAPKTPATDVCGLCEKNGILGLSVRKRSVLSNSIQSIRNCGIRTVKLFLVFLRRILNEFHSTMADSFFRRNGSR